MKRAQSRNRSDGVCALPANHADAIKKVIAASHPDSCIPTELIFPSRRLVEERLDGSANGVEYVEEDCRPSRERKGM